MFFGSKAVSVESSLYFHEPSLCSNEYSYCYTESSLCPEESPLCPNEPLLCPGEYSLGSTESWLCFADSPLHAGASANPASQSRIYGAASETVIEARGVHLEELERVPGDLDMELRKKSTC